MLTLTVPGVEYFDERKQEFLTLEDSELVLEHSLISLSKWEMKWKKPFLSKEEKTQEQTIDYIKCMTLNEIEDETVYYRLSAENYKAINEYIDDPMTATWFREDKNQKQGRDVITNELIYYWMIALNIPLTCENWHLNRLFTLIKVCNTKNAPSKKMSKRDIAEQNRALNEARRKQLNTNG